MVENETFEELEQLKSQMSLLKRRLGNEPIVGDEQIVRVAKEYRHGNVFWVLVTIGCLSVLYCGVPVLKLFSGEEWLTLDTIRLILGFVQLYCMIDMAVQRMFRRYSIDGDVLKVKSGVGPTARTIRIAISTIRYVELLNVGRFNRGRVRIVFNKFDDCYIDSKQYAAIIADLLRVNPDIEIRKEL